MSALLASLAPDILATLAKVAGALLPLLATFLAGRQQVTSRAATETARIKDAELQAAAARPAGRTDLVDRLRGGKF